MIKETGKIISITKQHDETVVVVECISKSACSGCNNQDSCGVGAVSKSHTSKAHHFEVPYKKGMNVDQTIELQISNSDLIRSAILAYLVPLVFFIGSAIVVKQFTSANEGITILIAISCATTGFVFTRVLSNKLFPPKEKNNIISTNL